MIAMDTVRWDRTSLADYARPTTPHLAEFAALDGATTFTRAYTDAAWSLPAYSSLFSGRGPMEHGVGFSVASLDSGHATLAEIMAAYGYDTAGFTSGPHLHASTGLSHGFQTYFHDEGLESMTPAIHRSLHWLDNRDGDSDPFFLFVHGYDAHTPYSAPAAVAELFDPAYDGILHKGLRDRPAAPCASGNPTRVCMHDVNVDMGEVKGMATRGLGDSDLEHLRAHYDASVLGADHQLGWLLYSLQERDLLEDSLVIVLSDHGESLGEDGRFGHESEAGDEVFHVPLVVKTPESTPPARWGGMVLLSEVLPTLVERIGAQLPAGVKSNSFIQALGQDKPFPDSDEVIRSASVCCYWVRSAGWELRGWKDPHRLRDFSRERRWTLHENGTGPDVLDQHVQVAENLKTYVAGWPERLENAASVSHGPAGHNPQMRKMLREKGYWAPDGGAVR